MSEPVEVILPTPWEEIAVGDEITVWGRRQRVTAVTPAEHVGPHATFTITAVDAEVADRLGALPWYYAADEEKP